jgi:hypothetical protein
MISNLSDRRERHTANRRLAKKRVQCLNEALCFVSSSVVADSLVLRNPLLRQAPKRYRAFKLIVYESYSFWNIDYCWTNIFLF